MLNAFFPQTSRPAILAGVVCACVRAGMEVSNVG